MPTAALASRLSSVPPTPPPAENSELPTITPRAAARIQDAAEKREKLSSKKKGLRKQVIDSVTELDDNGYGQSFGGEEEKDISSILGEVSSAPAYLYVHL